MPTDVREFFESYRDAFNRLDAADIASHFDVPCLIANQNGPAVFRTAEEVLSNCAALAVHFQRLSYSNAEFEAREFIPQNSSLAVANLFWTVHKKDEYSALTFQTTYSLRKLGNQWRIFSATAYE